MAAKSTAAEKAAAEAEKSAKMHGDARVCIDATGCPQCFSHSRAASDLSLTMESSSRRSASSLPLLSESSKCRSMTSTVLRSVKRFFSCASICAAFDGWCMRSSISATYSAGSSELICGLRTGMLQLVTDGRIRSSTGTARYTPTFLPPCTNGSACSNTTSPSMTACCLHTLTTSSVTSVSSMSATSSPSSKPIGTTPPKRSTPGMRNRSPWTTLIER
mmetsp:Transcript_9057/g.19766  ORF Transcript_9057/g.19766 Transcript_9057/m.19766 type:complete len:218 (-) Transcript_9057:733-1386(-)